MGVSPKLVLLLTENDTIVAPRDVGTLVEMAVEAEAAGFDAVMVSEHIVLGPSAGAKGRMRNPREYAMPGNQDPATPWPNPIVLLSAIAARTTRLRLVAGAIIAPLRHPLLLAKELATLDLLSEGRLVVIPTVSWHQEEFVALGVPFDKRGELLDDHLAAWQVLWRETPASFQGLHYAFDEVCLEPKAFRPGGPTVWIGGSSVHPRLVRRLVAHGHGFAPLHAVTSGDLEQIADAMAAAGRSMSELELLGGTRGRFSDADGLADLDGALRAIPPQLERGFTTIGIKPSQFIDDREAFAGWCRTVVERVGALAP